jgi:hypothetical protein
MQNYQAGLPRERKNRLTPGARHERIGKESFLTSSWRTPMSGKTKIIGLAAFAVLAFGMIAGAVYGYQAYKISVQDDFIDRFIILQKQIRIARNQDDVESSTIYGSKTIDESDVMPKAITTRSDKKLKALASLEKEIMQSTGMSVTELFYRYEQRYPWKKGRY